MARRPRLARHVIGVALLGSLAALLVVEGCGGDAVTPAEEIDAAAGGNRSPLLASQANVHVDTGHVLRVQAHASDPDGDVVRYAAVVVLTPAEVQSGHQAPATMDEATGWFTFVPTLADAPRRTVVFIADDGMGGRDSTQFVVDVKDKHVGAPN